MNNSHPNSRKIVIYRSSSFIEKSQNAKENEQVSNYLEVTSRSVGPYWASFTSRIIGSGLNIAETQLLMPWILSMTKEDQKFHEKVFEWFNSINTKVPYQSGRELEIGLEKDNSEPVSADNMPIKIEDYVRYRHAKSHPWVATSETEANGNQLKQFYIYDSESAIKEQTDKLALQDEADMIWLNIKNHTGKVNMLLTLMGGDERDFAGRNAEARKQQELRERINKKPYDFIKVYKDQNFETLYWVKAMEQAKVIQLVGHTYVIASTGKTIGKSMQEVVLFLLDKDNVETVHFLKGATQDVMKKPRAATNRKATTK